MTVSTRLSVAGALSVLLACTSLLSVYDGLGWVLRVAGAIVVVAAAGAVARARGLAGWVAPLAGLAALTTYVVLVFAGGSLAYLLVPTGETVGVLVDTVRAGLRDVEQLAPPVPSRTGLVLLAVLGAGAVALVVDLLAVTLRRAAVAGLPLLLLFAVPSGVLPGGLGVLPFLCTAAGWLALLLADGSDAASRWGTSVHPGSLAGTVDASGVSSGSAASELPTAMRQDAGLGRAGRRIGAAALGVALVVPAVIPGLDGRLFDGNGNGGGSGGGSRTATTYNPILELAGQLSLPFPRELLRYRTTETEPDYLRLTTLDLFDENSGWSSSALSGDPDDDAVRDGIDRPTGLSAARTRSVDTTLEVTGDLDGRWLPVPFPPEEVAVEGTWLWDSEAETVFSTRMSLQDVDGPYTVTAARVAPSAALLRAASSVPSEIAETYAQRPELAPAVQQLLDETVAGKDTDYDRVAAVQALFRNPANRFTYDEEAVTPGADTPDALENFLERRRGYCEQYASAMGALVRGLGLPARVAVGFTPGTRVRGEANTWLVTTSEAHAWPEVWFSGAGWVRFEPTPRSDQATTPDYTTAPEPATPSPGASAAPTAAAGAGATAPGNTGAVDRGADLAGDSAAGVDTSGALSRWLLLVPAAALLLSAPWLLAALRRRHRWRHADELTGWSVAQDDATDLGHRWRPADSPRAAAADLLSRYPLPAEAGQALHRLAASAERARYARPDADAAPGSTTSSQARHDARTVRGALMDLAPARSRWVARLASPSTLRSVGAVCASRAADGLDGVDRVVGAVAARVRGLRRRSRAAS